jgi:hypothetical protein
MGRRLNRASQFIGCQPDGGQFPSRIVPSRRWASRHTPSRHGGTVSGTRRPRCGTRCREFLVALSLCERKAAFLSQSERATFRMAPQGSGRPVQPLWAARALQERGIAIGKNTGERSPSPVAPGAQTECRGGARPVRNFLDGQGLTGRFRVLRSVVMRSFGLPLTSAVREA